jgi:pterin-4a-carbinolamine dehydratase
VRIWTHAIDGLHENDFVIAAKIDALDSTGSQKG